MLHTWSTHYCVNTSVCIVTWCCTPGQYTTVSTCQSVLSNDVAHLVNTLLCQHVSLFYHMMLHTWSTHYCVNMSVCFITWCCTPGQHTTVSTCQSVLSHDVAHLVNTLLCQHVSLFYHMMLYTWSKHYCVNMSVCFITWCCTPGQHTTVSTCQSVLSHDVVHLVKTLLCQHVSLFYHMMVYTWSTHYCVHMSVCNVTWYCTAGLVNSQRCNNLPTKIIPYQSCHTSPTQYPVRVAIFTHKHSTLSKLPCLPAKKVPCHSCHTSPIYTVPCQSCHTSPTNTIPCQTCHTSPTNTIPNQSCHTSPTNTVPCQSWSTTSGDTLHPQTQYLVKVGSVLCSNTLHPQTQYLVTKYRIKVGVHQAVTHFTHKHSTLSKLECIKWWHTSPTNTVPCQSWSASSGDTLHPQTQYLVKVGVHQVVTHFTHKHSTLSKLECIKWWHTSPTNTVPCQSWSASSGDTLHPQTQYLVKVGVHQVLAALALCHRGLLVSVPPSHAEDDQGRWLLLQLLQCWHSSVGSHLGAHLLHTHQNWAQIHFTHTYHSCLLSTLWMRTNR